MFSSDKYLLTVLLFCCCIVTKLCPTLQPHGLQPTRLFHPWDFSSKKIGIGYHFLLQAILPTQQRTLCLLHWQEDAFTTEPLGKPCIVYVTAFSFNSILIGQNCIKSHLQPRIHSIQSCALHSVYSNTEIFCYNDIHFLLGIFLLKQILYKKKDSMTK